MAAPWTVTGTVIAANGFTGAAPGVAVTAANSDDNASGTIFDGVQALSLTTVNYVAGGAQFVRSGGAGLVRWDAVTLGTLSTNDCGAIYITFDTLPSAYASFVLRQQTDGGTASFRIKVSNLGNVRLTDATDATDVSSTTNPVVAGTEYRFEWQINHTTGAYVLEWFVGHSTTPVNRLTGTSATLGPSATQVQFGALTAPEFTATISAVAIGSAKLGPKIHASLPPTVAAIADKTAQVGGSQTFTAVGNDPEGGTLSYAWSITSYPGGTTPTLTGSTSATVTVGNLLSDGEVVLSVTPTSSIGGAGTPGAAVLHVAKAPGSSVFPDAIISNSGAWVGGGTATSVLDGLTDTGEWIMTPNGPSGASISIGLPPLASTDVAIDFFVDLVQSDGVTAAAPGSTGTILAQLFDGTTAKSAQVSQALSPTEVHVVLTLTPTENAAYTVRTDPRVVLTASASA